MVLRQRKSAERSAPHLYVLCARVFRVLMRCFERSHAFRLLTAILRDRLRCRRHTMTREIAVFRVLTGHFTISMRRRARFRASLLFTLNWKGTSAYTFLCPVAVWGILPSLNSGASGVERQVDPERAADDGDLRHDVTVPAVGVALAGDAALDLGRALGSGGERLFQYGVTLFHDVVRKRVFLRKAQALSRRPFSSSRPQHPRFCRERRECPLLLRPQPLPRLHPQRLRPPRRERPSVRRLSPLPPFLYRRWRRARPSVLLQ